MKTPLTLQGRYWRWLRVAAEPGQWETAIGGFSVDQDGNFYTAAVDTGGAQKFTPRKGANPAMLVAKPTRVAWQN